jgi:serine phosphatase RsbU (regulator of sigma subunit)
MASPKHQHVTGTVWRNTTSEFARQPAATAQELLDDVRSFASGQPVSDDITVVMMQAS